MSGPSSPETGHSPVPLPAHLPVGELAWRSVTTVAAALGGREAEGADPERVAAAYRSDRHLRIDGARPDVWAPLSRFWRTQDGWVRTHGNYPHHEAAMLTGLRLSRNSTADDVGALLRSVTTSRAVEAISGAGGLCVPVQREDPVRDAALRRHPMVETERVGDFRPRHLDEGSTSRPLAGVRVLDLTRVIAGPVATRTLAFAGADVLRIDPPTRPEFAWQHLDTGHGKRTALLDIRAHPQRFETLLDGADVIVLGYRPDGLRRLALSPAALVARHPHLTVAQLTAWQGPHSARGFDSLVQAESGIAWLESDDGETPGALPAQGLDHSAGYLLAAGVAEVLRRRAAEGGTWIVRTSLRRVAAELLGMPRDVGPGTSAPPPKNPATQTFSIGGRDVTTVVPAVMWPGAPDGYAPPREWGTDRPEW